VFSVTASESRFLKSVTTSPKPHDTVPVDVLVRPVAIEVSGGVTLGADGREFRILGDVHRQFVLARPASEVAVGPVDPHVVRPRLGGGSFLSGIFVPDPGVTRVALELVESADSVTRCVVDLHPDGVLVRGCQRHPSLHADVPRWSLERNQSSLSASVTDPSTLVFGSMLVAEDGS
jgi:hypothetical protein